MEEKQGRGGQNHSALCVMKTLDTSSSVFLFMFCVVCDYTHCLETNPHRL